jgi:hypothetical protein
MLTTVNNKKTVILAIVLISFAFAVYAEDDNEIVFGKIINANAVFYCVRPASVLFCG